MEFANLSLKEIIELIQNRKVTATELVSYYISRIQKFKSKNAVLEVFDDALLIAKEKDDFAKSNSTLPLLHGIPVLIKDNISYKGHRLTCASKFLENFSF